MSQIPTDTKQISFNVTLEGDGLTFVRSCLEKGYFAKLEDYFDRAGAFLEWGIKTVESGDKVAIFNEDKMLVTMFHVGIPIEQHQDTPQKPKPSTLTLVVDNTK